MNEEIGFIIDAADKNMRFSIEHLERVVKYSSWETNPVMLKGVMIEYYGVPTPLSQVSNINTPDAEPLLFNPGKNLYLLKLRKEFQMLTWVSTYE